MAPCSSRVNCVVTMGPRLYSVWVTTYPFISILSTYPKIYKNLHFHLPPVHLACPDMVAKQESRRKKSSTTWRRSKKHQARSQPSKSVGTGPGGGEHQMAAKQHLVLKDKPSRSQPSISKNRKKSRIFRRPSLRCLGTFYRDGKFQSRDLVLIRDETSRPELVIFIDRC